MVPTSQQERRSAVIEKWILWLLDDNLLGTHLRMDEIDEVWRPRERWIDAAFASFDLAFKIRDQRHIPLILYAALSLEPAEIFRGLDFRTREELEERLDHPPSLYLVRPGEGPWDEVEEAKRERLILDDGIAVPFEAALLGAPDPVPACYFVEFKRIRDRLYVRNLFITG
jgi:hypothetical protein